MRAVPVKQNNTEIDGALEKNDGKKSKEFKWRVGDVKIGLELQFRHL